MKAMVLAAGKGTRLFPLTGVLPKPMARPRMFSYAGSERVTDGTRTRDLRSHNPMLYQLSYGHQAYARFYQEKVRGKTRRSEG
jgi:mannose-1-phosphate guanylyltransferase